MYQKSTLALLTLALVACGQDSNNSSTSAESAAPQANTAPAASSTPVAVAQKPERNVVPAIDFDGFDRSVAPQDDFFGFVNGGWDANTEIPADKSRYGSFSILFDESREAVKSIIEDYSASADLADGSDGQKIRDLYNSFMDEAKINELGATPLAEELAKIDQINSKIELSRYFAHSLRLGIPRPVAAFIGQDQKATENYIVQLNQSGLGLPDRGYYFDEGERADELRTQYKAFLARLAELAEFDQPEELANQVFELEKALAEHHWTRVENRDRNKTYNKMTPRDIRDLAPSFDWTEFFAAAGVSSEKEMIVRQPSYFEGMSRVFEQTPLNTWKQYAKIKVVSDASPFLSDAFVDASFDFYSKTLRGVQQQEERWKRGVNIVNGTVGMLVGKEYVKRHFPPEAKKRMGRLVSNLKVAMRESIIGLEWMSEDTKVQAHDKLSKFTTKIGYPDEWEDFSGLEILAGDLLGNLTRASAFQFDKNIAKLGGPVDRGEWFLTPQTVNAYYNPSMNEIVFPAAILQPPFFNLDADDAVNYGGIGVVIGHEIGHGFDDQGRKSDGNGILRDWWTESDTEEYTKRSDQLVAQYEGFYPVEDEHINGHLTLGENIGDLGGTTLAWRAFQHSKNGTEPEPLDGFTADQRFFLSFAQIWRTKSRESALRQQLKTDPHSPPKYRVMGVLPNFGPFYEAFDVKPEHAMWMDPEQRVSIW